jgi:hypothetical protein
LARDDKRRTVVLANGAHSEATKSTFSGVATGVMIGDRALGARRPRPGERAFCDGTCAEAARRCSWRVATDPFTRSG